MPNDIPIPEGYVDQLQQVMDDQYDQVIIAYDELITQCNKLAVAMHFTPEYVLSKVMPKVAKERTDTKRIEVWYDKELETALHNQLFRYQVQQHKMNKQQLIDSLGLTDAQKELLDLK